MLVDWEHFNPISALLGGALLGVSAAIFIVFSGRIAGVSGIVGGLLKPANAKDALWRVAFVSGLVIAPLVYSLLAPASFAVSPPQVEATWPILVIAGLLVGFGTRLGSGCTSGHGVCGISRLSMRSIVATLTFMATGGITVYIARHLIN